ncbi:hypothetical protein LSM04_005771 [Trypanosoma melophagium]|uniref:uncharacterized protein n=1 Tax=Trypanosoma melophagium TaxID=715481 RepID=UPI00351A5242|nr:hypothetical protein LSM04_005771 [Trypanosoma melophagium]
MLLAQRKQRQKLTGKIGHNDAEYDIGRGNNAGILQGIGGQKRSPERPRDVIPYADHNQQQQAYQYRFQQPQPQQEQVQQAQRSPPVMPSNLPPMNLSPWRSDAPYADDRNACQLPMSFPSMLPPISAAPLLPAPLAINRSPMRFTSALDGGINVPLSTNAAAAAWTPPSPYSVQPILQQQQQQHAPVSSLPQVPHPAPRETSSLPAPSGVANNRRNYGSRPPSRHSPGLLPASVMPGQSDEDEASARQLARQRAIEVQNENARLCEERRRRREIEKQREVEEERRLERLAQAEVGQAELGGQRSMGIDKGMAFMEERREAEERVRLMGRKAAQAEQRERKRASSEERERTRDPAAVGASMPERATTATSTTAKTNSNDNYSNNISNSNMRVNSGPGPEISGSGGEGGESMAQNNCGIVDGRRNILAHLEVHGPQNPSSHTLPQSAHFVQQPLGLAVSGGTSPYVPQPFTLASDPILASDPLRDVHAIPTFDFLQPLSFPSATPSIEATAPAKTVPDTVQWSAPLSNFPIGRTSSSSSGAANAKRMESQLQDIVSTHNIIHHVLESEANRDARCTPTPYSSLPPMFSQPTSSDPLQSTNSNDVSQQVSGAKPGVGILKKSPEQPVRSGIEIIGVNIPRNGRGGGGGAAAVAAETETSSNIGIPSSAKTTTSTNDASDDLSAEPSKFVGVVPLMRQ